MKTRSIHGCPLSRRDTHLCIEWCQHLKKAVTRPYRQELCKAQIKLPPINSPVSIKAYNDPWVTQPRCSHPAFASVAFVALTILFSKTRRGTCVFRRSCKGRRPQRRGLSTHLLREVQGRHIHHGIFLSTRSPDLARSVRFVPALVPPVIPVTLRCQKCHTFIKSVEKRETYQL
jgi:hypothetical protein